MGFRIANLPRMEFLRLEAMASGNLCLNLSENVNWEDFEAYATSLLHALRAKKIKVADSVEMRLWDISIEGEPFALVWNDFPAMVSLESSTTEGDAILRRLASDLGVA